MQYTVTRNEKGKVDVKVDVSKADFEKTYTEVLEKLGKEAKIDGFRPGNVPVDLVENKIGLNKILNETASFLVSKHLAEVFDKETIVPIVNPKVAIDNLTKSEPFSFRAEVIARPNVKLGDWKTIKVKKVKAKEVVEADVDASIANIFDAWKKQKKGTNETEESKEAEDTGKFIYDAQGNKIPIREDAPKASKDEINDEFAKAIGAQSLSHLKELVRKDLESIVADQVELKFEEEIFDEILKLGEVEVPDILVDDEVNRMMVRLNQQVEKQGKKMDDFLQEENTTLDALRAKWRVQAEKNVKVTLMLDEIGHKGEIKVTKEEIDNAAKGVNTTDITPQQKIDLEKYLAVTIFQAKTLDLVKKTVTAG